MGYVVETLKNLTVAADKHQATINSLIDTARIQSERISLLVDRVAKLEANG
jgi:hypothetical protein